MPALRCEKWFTPSPAHKRQWLDGLAQREDTLLASHEGNYLADMNFEENLMLPLWYHQPGRLPQARRELELLARWMGWSRKTLFHRTAETLDAPTRRAGLVIQAALLRPAGLVLDDLYLGLAPDETPAVCRAIEGFRLTNPFRDLFYVGVFEPPAGLLPGFPTTGNSQPVI